MFFALFLVAFANCKPRKRRSIKYDAQKEGRWFSQQLTKYQKPFYEALEYWRKNNLLTGAPMMYLESDKNIKNNVQQTIIKQCVMGASSALNTHFLSAIAAWRADHPEVFYVDVSKLLFRLSKDDKNEYHILFGCISYPNLLYDFVNPDQIDSMIERYNAKVQEVANLAKDKSTIEEKVTVVHDYLKGHVVYNRPYQTDTVEEANWVYESYGSLILGKSVCDGFSKAFQVIMDTLNVPAIRVPGDALNSSDASQSHSWNVVEVGDQWYLVDCTYDTTAKTNKWLLINQINTSDTHFPNGNLDSCGVTFYFPPALFPNYEKWSYKLVYNKKDPTIVEEVFASYDGMNSKKLRAINYSFCYRYASFKSDGTIQLTPWIDMYAYGVATDMDTDSFDVDDNYSRFTARGISFGEVGLADINSERINWGMFQNCAVRDEDVTLQSTRIYINTTFENMSMNENLLNPQVRYFSPTPRHFWPGHEYDFVLAMSEKLISEDDNDDSYTKFNITVTAESLNTFDRKNGREKILGEEAAKRTVLHNIRLINDQTIGVTIKTSDSYAHDHMDYTLHFHGVRGAVSLKEPLPFTFMVHFFPNNGGTNTCSKMFGTGTLYVAGRPVLITDGDIRNGGLNDEFTATDPDKNIIPGKGATSSDIALVATRAEGDDENYEEFTATFDISLTLFCISYLITPGTYNCPLTIQLPFPDGFDPTKNEGVSFEVIHYNKDGTVNEKNTVVVGSAGLLITVNGFSPFKIQPKKNSALSLEDPIYPLYTSPFGGSPKVTIGDKKITNIVHAYKKDELIKVEPPTGTKVEKIFLNSEPLSVDDLTSFKLNLDSLNTKSNTLEIHLITDNAQKEEKKINASPVHITANITAKSQSEEAKALTAKQVGAYPPANNLNEDNAIVPPGQDDYDDNYDKDAGNTPDGGDGDGSGGGSNGGKKPLDTGAIIGIVVGVVAAIAIVVLLVYFLVIRPRRKHQDSDANEQQVADSSGI